MKRFFRDPLFSKKSLFFGLIFFLFGFAVVFPVVPEKWQTVAAVSEIPESVVQREDEEALRERCRWQEDVKVSLVLLENLSEVSQSAMPCDAVIPVSLNGKKEKHMASEVVDSEYQENDMEKVIREMAMGYPIERMATAIAKYDRKVAALIVGIAKKESNWGKRVPLDDEGNDCFNYWGYKGAGSRGVAMGHSCFGSPEEAVEAVGNRLAKLVELKQTSEPKHLIVWKCGSSCKGHSDESVRKWISDVDTYYRKIAVQ